MADAFAYCADIVRTTDRDRFVASLFAPAERRGALHALYAFNSEVARVREAARASLAGEMRLQWWSEVVAGERNEEARASPIATALLATVDRYRLGTQKLLALIEERRFDLYDEPMAGLAELDVYASATSSALFALAARILAGSGHEEATEPAGKAYAITALLRAFPQHIARRQLYLPADLLQRHDVSLHDLFAGKSSAALSAALAEMCGVARRYLDAAREPIAAMPREAHAALLPLAPVRASLDRLEHGDPFAPSEIAPWRRQWLIWRAARNPARIVA